MTTGLTRRDGAQDNLAGRDDMQPVTLQGPGLQSPRAVRAPDRSAQQQVADRLSAWSGAKFNEALNKQHEKDLLEGQMAYQQGKTFDEVKMGGNKWALEGYRLMDAQALASSFLAAQRQEIASGGYEMSQDGFRSQYINRLDAQLEGVDARTAELVRAQMGKQMPTLVADHTTQHLQWQEKQNYDSLERGIDVISRDPTATEALVDFARGGEDSPSAGLSTERRQAATVDGVIRAFDNDNPLAYSTLAKEGLLGDNLSSEQQNAIRAAQQRFQSRRRKEYNEELFSEEQALMSRVERGEVDPAQAVEELSVMYAKHGIEMNKAEAGAIYEGAEHTSRQKNLSTGYLIEEAGLRGDVDTQAAIIHDMLVRTESSGNTQAWRTNKDGRSFGGLVQFGQRRLNETLDANGIPRMSLREFANLSAPEQRRIGIMHFSDLIRRAQATGAIGTQINGVTVTLSGLVAVGHLGGWPGMEKFVRTQGEYNPSDELGTSLTDYLREHASGERQEIFTSGEQLQRSRSILEETKERLAMETYSEMAPQLAMLDDMFRKGELNKDTWQFSRGLLYEQYGEAQTRADVNHEIAVIRSVDQQAASAAQRSMDEQYKLALERSNAEITPARLAWEEVISNAESGPEEIRAANQAYIEARREVFSNNGIAAIDRKDGAVAETVITRTKEAMDRNRQFTEEQVEIDAAVAGGYLDRLPANLQTRAFEQAEQEIVQTYSDEVARGTMTEDQAQAEIATDLNAFYASAGAVPPRVKMVMSAAVMDNNILDSDGNPNPRMVDAISNYANVRELNPRAADKMLDEDARIRAEAALAKAGGDTSLIAEGVRSLGLQVQNSPLSKSPEELQADPKITREIDQAVTEYLSTRDIGVLQAIWSGEAFLDQRLDNSIQAENRMNSPEVQEKIRSGLVSEVERLHSTAPNMSPRDLVTMAANNMSRRTEVIGGDVITLPAGHDFGEHFFGGHAAEFMHEGAINSATMEWLRSDGAREQYPFLDDVHASEWWPQFARDLATGVTTGLGLDQFAPTSTNSFNDSRRTLASGVRPFRAFRNPAGGIVVEVDNGRGGYHEPIIIPMREAGELYMNKRRQQMAQ